MPFGETEWTCFLEPASCPRSASPAAGSSSPPITVTVNVAPNAPLSVTNTATVSGGGEQNTSNDSAADPTIIGLPPDVTITKTHSGSFSQGQTGAAYTLTASNVGQGPTAGTVTVPDTLPTGLT